MPSQCCQSVAATCVIERVIPIAGALKHQEAIGRAKMFDVLTTRASTTKADGYDFFDTSGDRVGWLTSRSPVSQELNAGRVLIHASVNSIGGEIRARLVTGDPGETYEPAPMLTKTYKINVVGEQHYQSAVVRCDIGDAVVIIHELGNPHDDRALAVGMQFSIIGYLPRDSWVHRAVFDEGKGCAARIVDRKLNPRDFFEVVLDIAVGDFKTYQLDYAQLQAMSADYAQSCTHPKVHPAPATDAAPAEIRNRELAAEPTREKGRSPETLLLTIFGAIISIMVIAWIVLNS